MGMLDNIIGALGDNKGKNPHNQHAAHNGHGKNNPQDIMAKAQKLSAQHGDKINKAIDTLQAKIPGQKGDKLIDSAQRKFTELGKNGHDKRHG